MRIRQDVSAAINAKPWGGVRTHIVETPAKKSVCQMVQLALSG